MSKKIIIIIIALVLTSSAFIFDEAPLLDENKIEVTASFYPLAFFAEEIGGENVVVHTITPAGVEPHDYEPTAQDLILLERSALILLNGGGFEPWAENVRQNIDSSRTLFVKAGEGLTNLREGDDEGNKMDPHVWLSPELASIMVDRIEKGFAAVDPDHYSSYAANANALKDRLQLLDGRFTTGLSVCARKDMVTSHAAFGYLAARYGLNQISITGISPEEEPSTARLAEIAAFAKDHNVKYIFFEELVSPRLAVTIATEIGASVLVLNPLEGLRPEEAAKGKNYFTEMESNLVNLRLALECQ